MRSFYFVISTFILMLIAAATMAGPLLDTKCEYLCSSDYDPICATNDEGQTRTFNNDCVRRSQNCVQKSNFQKRSEGPCP